MNGYDRKKALGVLIFSLIVMLVVFLFTLNKPQNITDFGKPYGIAESKIQSENQVVIDSSQFDAKYLEVSDSATLKKNIIHQKANDTFKHSASDFRVDSRLPPLPNNVNQKAFADFNKWLLLADASTVDEGIRLAHIRQVEMLKLIEANPQEALNHSVNFSQYAKLPLSVAQFVEKPFSQQVDIDILPNEPDQNSKHPTLSHSNIAELSLSANKKSYLLKRHGSRATILSKQGISAQGILIEGMSVIKDMPLTIVTGEELLYALKHFVSVNNDTYRDFYTREIIEATPVVALAGGQLFYFASVDNVEQLNKKLLLLEQKIDPKLSSNILFKLSATYIGEVAEGNGGGLPPKDEIDLLLAAPSTWTTTKKKVFFIRVDFPDKPGKPVAKNTLKDELNGATSLAIRRMSRGKTWIEAEVSDQVVHLSSSSTEYAPSRNRELHADVVTAFNELGSGVNLNDYDIVGIYFSKIGMKGAGETFEYAGLGTLGGGDHWLQGTYSSDVITHEFGHNYGLQHASFWETSNDSAIGESGVSEEYGDIYDIMGSGDLPEASYHPQALAKLEWLDSSEWQEVTVSGLYRIYRFDNEVAQGLQGLKVSRGNGDYYWLGNRESYDTNVYQENGFYLTWQPDGYTKSWLVDTTPGSFTEKDADKQDAGVVLGQTYADSEANIYLTAISKGGASGREWIDVQINLEGSPSNQAPSVNIDIPTEVKAREPIIITASAADPEGDDLAYQWDFGDGSASSNSSVIRHQWVVGGDYTVKVTVSDMKGKTTSVQLVVNVSDPLLSWQTRTSGTINNLNAIANSENMVVVVGNNGVVLRSVDGDVWQSDTFLQDENSNNISAVNLRFRSLLYAEGKWVAVGYDYDFSISAWVGVIFTSNDAQTWIRRHKEGERLMGVTATSGTYITVGDEGTILKSLNTEQWEVVNSGTNDDLQSVAYGNGVFVAVGVKEWTSFFTTDGSILASSDGVNWIDRVVASSGSKPPLFDLMYLDNSFIATGYYAGIQRSIDQGINFKEVKAVSSYGPKALAFGNGVFFVAGEEGQNYVSVDGFSWSNSGIDAQNKRNAAVNFKNTFISVADGGGIYQSSILSTFVTSNDGDYDGVADSTDNCPLIANTNQSNQDSDELGDVCDEDQDGDGVKNTDDAFPSDANESLDTDQDGIGNNADFDDDNDGLSDSEELSLNTNPLKKDSDGDGVNDKEDKFPNNAEVSKDTDSDGIGDALDNCPNTANMDQEDKDSDAKGDVCDDRDNRTCNLDIDDSGEVKPLTDGLLLLRSLFGFRDAALTNSAISPVAERSLPENIQSYISGCSTVFDIDNSGDVKPLTDGLLVLRYLFGFRNEALIEGSIATNAQRKDAQSIAEYIQSKTTIR